MPTYTILTEVSVREGDEKRLIETARQHYRETQAVGLKVDGEVFQRRGGPAEEQIQTPVEAINEIGLRPDLFEAAGVHVRWNSCTTATINDPGFPDASTAEVARDTAASSADGVSSVEDLDQPNPGVYLYRWPNGDFTVLYAESAMDALLALDEFGEAGPTDLAYLDGFLADFELTDKGAIVLNRFGEDTNAEVWEYSYPALAKTLAELDLSCGEDTKGRPAGQLRRIRQAVQQERERGAGDSIDKDKAQTATGRHIQEVMHMSGPVADYFVKQAARRHKDPSS